MAAGNAIRYLQEETTCAVCLGFFQDPVMILSCGHNFCRRCVSRCAAGAPCPQCRVPFPHGGLRRIRQLADGVGAVQELAPRRGRSCATRTSDPALPSVTAVQSSSAPPASSIAPAPPCRSKRPLAGEEKQAKHLKAKTELKCCNLKQFEASLKTFQEEDKQRAGLTEAAKETRREMLTRVNAEKQKLQAMLKGLCRVLSDQESRFLSWLHCLCWRLEEQQRGEADEMTWIRQCRAELQAKRSNWMVTCYGIPKPP